MVHLSGNLLYSVLQESEIIRRDAARFIGLHLMGKTGYSCWDISSVGAVGDRPSFHLPWPSAAANGSYRRGKKTRFEGRSNAKRAALADRLLNSSMSDSCVFYSGF